MGALAKDAQCDSEYSKALSATENLYEVLAKRASGEAMKIAVLLGAVSDTQRALNFLNREIAKAQEACAHLDYEERDGFPFNVCSCRNCGHESLL